jgi:hypothetical protein
MSLMSMLAFLMVPLAKRAPGEDKAKIAELEEQLAQARREIVVWGRFYADMAEVARAAGDAVDHWRRQSNYWERAYLQLAAPNQWGDYGLRQQAQQQSNLLAQHYQQLADQNQQQPSLAAMNRYQQMGWECTCVPARADLLTSGQLARSDVRWD